MGTPFPIWYQLFEGEQKKGSVAMFSVSVSLNPVLAGACQVEIIVEGDELLNAGSIRWVSLIRVPSGLPDTVVHIAGVF